MNDSSVTNLPAAVLVILGPTASGKTELACELARRLDAEVVGADSRQIYRGMDVGTAKPSRAQRAAVAHHMIDVVDPDQPFDAAAWRCGAKRALTDIAARGMRAIVCGGTGLYVRSLTRGLFAGPPADAALRARLETADRERPGVLHARLRAVDPAAAERIHPNDRIRVVRALEVFELTGRRLSDWHEEHRLGERPFETLTLCVHREREDLHERIRLRSASIVEGGIVDELAALRARGYAPGLPAFSAIGYREAGACLDGRLPARELAGAVALATRQYAKRQLVWIRGQSDSQPVLPGQDDAVSALAARFFERVAKRQGIG